MKGFSTGLLLGTLALGVLASGRASSRVGPDDRAADATYEVPFIFWGGDVATFEANGGLETTPGSLLGKQGLKVKLTPGDDFDKQVEAYLANKTPFLRGTLSMLGQASDKLTAKPETTPVVFLQLTWSQGDHLVGRESLKKLTDLKGKKIALQEGGPHVGMLNDILLTARLTWDDITVVWTKDVSGPKGPAEKLRSDPSVAACFAITPEMMELTSAPESGGVESIGGGKGKSIKGAHVVISTAQMSRSIADVYACRKDFYDRNRKWIDRFAACYLKACEELVDARRKAASKEKAGEKRYKGILKLAQDVWGRDPAFKEQVAKEDDVDGLISDAIFVGVPGNESFFKSKGNLTGFEFKMKQAVRLPGDPAKERLRRDPKPFVGADLDYTALRKLGDLHARPFSGDRIKKGVELVDEQIVYSFEIKFEPDQGEFPAERYGLEFQRALELASLYGNTVVGIRGHADPCLLVQLTLKAATDAGKLKKKPDGSYAETKTDKALNPEKVKELLAFIERNPGLEYRTEAGSFQADRAVKSLKELSDKRADTVRQTVVKYAKDRGLLLDESQFRSKGVGVEKPVRINLEFGVVNPANRRVEFSIIKVPLKDVNPDAFEL